MSSSRTGSRGPSPPRRLRHAIATFAGAVCAVVFGVAFVAVAALTVIFGLLGSGCALSERIVDRDIISSPEMAFDERDLDRDLPGGDIGGGGGAGGGSGC